MDDEVRTFRLWKTAIIGVVVVLVVLIAGVSVAAMYNTQQNSKARTTCIQRGGTWIQANCVGGVK